MARKSSRKHKILHPLTLDPEIRARELASLSEFLRKPITQDRFNKWIGVAIGRTSLLADMVWGSIEWRRSLGKPLAARLADGFKITHKYQTIEFYDRGGGIYDEVAKWRDDEALVISDGPHDETTYRVTFFGRVPLLWVNRVEATFSAVPWEHPLHQARFLQILGSPRQFVNINSKVTVLAKMRVESGYVRAEV
jgi:hypothetical protein